MRLEHAEIRNFKALNTLSLPLVSNTGEPRSLTLLLGDNGSGKTTALQAIALVLSIATRRIREPSAFDWQGFLAERVASQGPSRVELSVVFEAEEMKATCALFDAWIALQPEDERHHHAAPSQLRRVSLIYEGGKLHSPQGSGALSQFLGRFYIREMLKADRTAREHFASVGDIFWFDQNRNLTTIGTDGEIGINRLRKHLIGWYAYHRSARVTPETDFLQRLENLFARFFPGARFIGTETRSGMFSLDDFFDYFLIQRDSRVYDIAEMSSGEQAIFPMLYEFVRLNITRSIVLIDELELHLHPPQQQMLISALKNIGPDCQFIVTTHSPYLESATPDEWEIRLPGGRRCL